MFPVLAGSNPSGYNLTRSLRFRSSASAYLNRTPASAGNQKTWTYSNWVKRGKLGAEQLIVLAGQGAGTLYFYLRFSASDALDIFTFDSNAGSIVWQVTTTQVFRDPSAWYHIVVSTDTTQATASNRVKIYVNGSQVTAFSTASYPSLNYDTRYNANIAHYISSYVAYDRFFDGYMAEFNSVDGQALTPLSFGSTNALTGVWQPARYAGTYGTNGFYLPFTDNSALTTSSNVGLGKDFSGNGNYWTTNNISITSGITYDSMTDVPTLTSATAANFCVLNPLQLAFNNSTPTVSDGNLKSSINGSFGASVGTFSVSSGKWYFEAVFAGNGAENVSIGWFKTGQTWTTPNVYAAIYPSGTSSSIYKNGSATGSTLTNYTSGTLGIALDLDNLTAQFYINGSAYGAQVTGLTAGSYSPGVFVNGSSGTSTINANFGQRPFAYTPPTGYVALNTYNLPTSTIVKGNTVMDATTYTGTGAIQSIVNAGGFKPDLLWIKNRVRTSFHDLVDSVRGVAYGLSSNDTRAELTPSLVTSLNSNGFTLPANTTSDSFFTNLSGEATVAWQWQAGQGTTSSNTSGTITSTVSVNASAGFSIVSYTGTGANATVGHGLGVAPSFIVVKCRNTAGENWQVYSSSLTSAAYRLRLNTTDAQDSQPTMWNSTAPTSSVFSVGTATGTNASTQTYVAYCFAPIAGYSAFGSYTGNGSTDGPFIYTGFRPKFVMVKVTSTTNWWIMFDSTRNPYNAANYELAANLSDAEYTATTSAYTLFDFLSNGFKLRTGSLEGNSSGQTYIYAAFAENPFRNALAR